MLNFESSVEFDSFLKTMDPRDVFYLMKHIAQNIDNRIEGDYVICFLNSVTDIMSCDNSLMKTIEVRFSVHVKSNDKSAPFIKWKGVYTCYRATSFACLNINTTLRKL